MTITSGQIQEIANSIRQGASIARAALYAGASPEDAYRWVDDLTLREAIHYRNKRYGVGWTDSLAATTESMLAPGAKQKRKALNAAREKDNEPKRRIAAYERILSEMQTRTGGP